MNSIEAYKEGKVVLIDKPLEWTSFQVVNKVRWLIKQQFNIKKIKVGHAGTLDPLATGLLILCTGKFTKKIETYQAQVKEYTGTITLGATTPSYDLESEIDHTFDVSKITPEEIHQMGLSEVQRISNRMNEILTSLGYDTVSKSVGQIMNELNENPDFLYADTPNRKEIVVNDYTFMVNEAIAVMSDYFHTMPRSEVVVKAVPEYSEKTAAGGYYQAPALDGSRPGVFYANLYDIKQTPTYSMRTLTYHEATPGHHHQIAHSLENEDLTLYRRFGYGTSAFAEGWALYAERLALEVGLAEDPYDELGILQSEIFRAVRLVVDTGMHYKSGLAKRP